MLMKQIVQVVAGLLLAVTLVACQAGGLPERSGPSSADLPTRGDVAAYQLGNGDELRLSVFGEPSLSGDFVVDGSGNVSLPLIGTVNVDGLTVEEFQAKVDRRLRDGYLNDPQVSAEVTSYRPYYILGEVNQPGEYPYTSGLTVLNAVATAQGFTYRANEKAVFIRTAGSQKERKVRLTSTTQVKPGDTIRIGERIF